LKSITHFQMYTKLCLRDFPENSYLAVNSNSLPTRLRLGKIAVELRLVYFNAGYVCVRVCVCVLLLFLLYLDCEMY
jgi:hypothetical protein